MDNIRNTWKNKPGVIILSALLVLVILALLAVLFVRGVVFRAGSRTAAEVPVVTTQSAPNEQQPDASAPTATATLPATKVVKATATAKPTNTPAATATPKPKPTATKGVPTKTPTPLPPTDTPTPSAPQIGNLLQNGDFEAGFGEDGVALGWQAFRNDAATVIFAPELWQSAIHDGDAAQRITITDATQPNRYAGLFQTVNVVPGKAYSLTLYGQIRTTFGDVGKSNYGYRMQYAVDWSGGTDWQAIPDDEWIELPWDEQLIDGSNMFFLDFSTELLPPSNTMTLFIRAWNKWPDQLEAQYTLDSLSLVGEQPAAVDEPLPETGGASAAPPATSDPRVWGGALFIVALLGGTLWRQRQRSMKRA